MKLPTRDDIDEASGRIRGHVRSTPVMEIGAGELGKHPALTLKLECLQHAGSFKARGAFNTLLSSNVPAAGVAAASGGNHGAAVAFAAGRLGIPARIFVPEISSPAKIARIRAAGADVVVEGARYADALARCEAFMAETGAMGIHAYEATATMAGQGTLAREWQAQSPVLDTVLVAVGGGGLIGGMTAWMEGSPRTVAVETEGCAAYHEARKSGRPVPVEVSGIAADSLGAKEIGSLAFEVLSRHDTPAVLVTDDAVAAARRVLWDRLRLAVEPGGATALAAILSGRFRPAADEKVGVLVCGANTDPSDLA